MKRRHVIPLVSATIMCISTIFACETFRFVTHDKKVLQGHVMLTMTTPYHQVCWSKCAAIINCLSVNTRSLVDLGVVTCELNNSSMRANTSKLGDHPEYQYHEMTATEPKLCSALECIRKEALEDGWYRYGNTAVKLINENKTWNDAKTHCKSLGSDLVTILSPRQSDFIRQVVVKDIYDRTTKQKESSLPDELVDYWPLDGSDFDVQPRDKPGDARYEIIDGEMSLYLSGYNSFAEVPAVVFNPEGFTTMLWIKLLNNTRQLVTFYSDWYAPLTTFLMGVHYPYKGLFTWFRNFNGEMKTTYYLNYRFEEWVHVAVSYTNKTLPAIKIYYNGTLKQTTSISNLVRQTIHSKFHLGIKGDDFPNSPKTMHGYMKHLMVFNKTLNEEEIKRCIAFVKPPAEPWIGLKGNNATKTYQWSDGTPANFLNMVPYKPGTGCVAMADNGQWFDTDCQLLPRPFVCEKYVP